LRGARRLLRLIHLPGLRRSCPWTPRWASTCPRGASPARWLLPRRPWTCATRRWACPSRRDRGPTRAAAVWVLSGAVLRWALCSSLNALLGRASGAAATPPPARPRSECRGHHAAHYAHAGAANL
ncbi:hypothetical protein POSPLADRAFT_1067412, partial [Postia placenta MAD-698-R-SB12]